MSAVPPPILKQRSKFRLDRFAALQRIGGAHVAKAKVPAGAGVPQEFDARTERCLASLHPKAQPAFRAAMRDWISRAAMDNLTVQIISGTRTFDEQHQLYLQGRNGDRRPIVTNADAGQSNHNYGIACDVGLFRGGQYLDDLAERGFVTFRFVNDAYHALVTPGESNGLTPGARWVSFEDDPHYELHPPFAEGMSESAMLRELLRRHNAGIDIFE